MHIESIIEREKTLTDAPKNYSESDKCRALTIYPQFAEGLDRLEAGMSSYSGSIGQKEMCSRSMRDQEDFMVFFVQGQPPLLSLS